MPRPGRGDSAPSVGAEVAARGPPASLRRERRRTGRRARSCGRGAASSAWRRLLPRLRLPPGSRRGSGSSGRGAPVPPTAPAQRLAPPSPPLPKLTSTGKIGLSRGPAPQGPASEPSGPSHGLGASGLGLRSCRRSPSAESVDCISHQWESGRSPAPRAASGAGTPGCPAEPSRSGLSSRSRAWKTDHKRLPRPWDSA